MEFRDKVKKVLEEIELPGLEVEIESEEYGTSRGGGTHPRF